MTRFRAHHYIVTPFANQKLLRFFIITTLVLICYTSSVAQVDSLSINRPDTTAFDSTRQLLTPLPDEEENIDTLIQLPKGRALSGRDSISALIESIAASNDTLYQEEVGEKWEDFKDSTARVEQFVHQRYDEPMVEMFPRDNYSLYLDPSQQVYKREIQLDTLGETITVRELVNGVDVKIPTTMKLEDYIHLRYEYEKQRSWRSIATQYTKAQTKDDLSNLLGSITNISITVPSNPISNIFGGTENNLRISGGVDIRGAFRNTTSDQSTISQLDRSRNEPDFNQNVQVNVSGTIGKKLNILADWNTQRTFEYENQLKIKYTGFDDEIIQSIEAGNVSLQTPSLVGGGQALFGIKAKLQTGPLTLTTLLSQKKGQTKELTISGGSTTTENTIQAHEYSKNHFFLDTVYAKYFAELHEALVPVLTSEIQANQILQLDIYATNVSTSSQTYSQSNYKSGRAYINLPSINVNENYTLEQIAVLSTQPGRYEPGIFVRLDPNKDYKFDRYGGYITLNSTPSDNQIIAVSYTIAGENNVNKVYGGTVMENDTLLYLKLIKPLSLTPGHTQAWKLLMKNFYSVRATNLKKDGFKLRVWRRSTAGADEDNIEGLNLLSVLGLDRFDQYNASGTDNNFDFIPGLTIDVDRGEVIFPTLRPFDSTIAQYFRSKNKIVGDSLLFGDIYDTTVTAAQTSIRNKYIIKVEAAGAQSSTFNLGSMNLVEGSVHVLLNGSPLTPNVDYTVDYIIGQVIIRRPEALVPGANLQIKYEQNDLFQLASKTLIGARGELDAFPNTKLGFTIMNLNQQTLSDKVRIGEEPTNNMMLGMDFSSSANLPFLTDAIDALPLIRTKEMSTLRFGGEGAYMIPDPNTKKSTVLSDHGASIAYIDDFEGIRRTIPFPITYAAWSMSSAPMDSIANPLVPDAAMNYKRSRLSWYNRLPTDVVTSDIWPNRRTRAGQNQVTVLNLDFDPNHRGTYNFSPNLDSTLNRQDIGSGTGKYNNPDARRENWGGIMRYIGSMAGDILSQNIAYIEIWMKASSDDLNDLNKGRMHIDLGRVSEDVIPDGNMNSEDIIRSSVNPGGIPNGVLNEGEDIGIDMIDDNQEKIIHTAFLASNSGDPDVDPNDPGGDNWTAYGDGTHLTKFNGTDQNKQDPAGLFPNTEDFNGNGNIDLSDQYLEYEIPLLDSTYIVGGGENGWYQYRIPLLEASRVFGGIRATDILQNVQYIRLWLSGFSQPVSIRIAELDLVGNQWQERLKSDSLMKVSVVNIEDNPQYSEDWGALGIAREKDRSDPNQVIEANEQSLALILTGLPKDTSREVVKYFITRPLDIFNYKSMKMFVHGDKSFTPGDAEIYLRFGTDTLNFYEYRQPIYPGWELSKNEINVIFSRITAVKSARPDSMTNKYYVADALNGVAGATYGVRGSPSLRQVREISIGIRCVNVPHLTGEVWVNELRLVDVDNSPGAAYRFDTQVKLADLGQVAFNYSRTDPTFHSLDQRFGNQTAAASWAVNASISIDRFLPQDWQGTSIPFAYSHSENIVKPKYLPNTDIVVEEAAKRASPDVSKSIITQSQTLNIKDSYSISNFRIVLPSQAWYIRDTFSKLSFAFNYNTTRDRDPSFELRKTWGWNLRVNYGVTLPNDYFLQPFSTLFKGIFFLEDYKDWKIYYIPVTSLSAGAGGSRSRSYEIPRAKNSLTRESRNFGASKSFGFGWKFTEGGLLNLGGDYGLSLDRNLLPLDNDSVGRDFLSIMKSLFFGGRDSRYGQKVGVNLKPKIPNILDLPKYFDFSTGYSVNYSWQNTFTKGDIGKSAAFDNNISMSLGFRLKSLTDPWFDTKEEATQLQPAPMAMNKPDLAKPASLKDSTSRKDSAQTAQPSESNTKKMLQQLRSIAKLLIKIPFLDYETINISYSQSNRSSNPAVLGSTGFKNFWGRLPFQGSLDEYGPSRLYQLGLIADPHGTLQFAPKSKFPFLGWKTIYGPRAAGAQLSDQYSQSNNITLRTNRPLWTGATIDINWKVGWQYSRTTTIITDSLGQQVRGEPTTSGSIDRSFLTLPPVLFMKVFKSNLETVGKKYEQFQKTDAPDVALVKAFEEGFEALPFLSKVLGPYVPRPNWTIRWDGIEKLVGLGSIMDRLSLEHNYSSNFRRDFRSYPGKGQRTDAERMSYGFSPLAGVNMTFKQVLKGSLSGNFRYNTTTNYDLNLAAQQPNIVSALAQEISFTLNYARRGFSFPLFGLNLSNDIEVSFTYSRTKSSRRRYDPTLLSSDQEGIPLEGNIRTVLEPRIRYVLSTRVTAALYYRYTKTAPDAAGSTIYGVTTNEAGVDIHISI